MIAIALPVALFLGAQAPAAGSGDASARSEAGVRWELGVVLAGDLGVDLLGRAGVAARGSATWPFLDQHVGGFIDVQGSAYQPSPLPPGEVRPLAASASVGAQGRIGQTSVRAGARGGALFASGLGFDVDRAGTAPLFELIGGVSYLITPVSVGFELAVPLVRPEFAVDGLSTRLGPPLFLGLSIGTFFGN